MKYGFMLIELIVATLIASMIGTLLLTALSQGTRFQKNVDMLVDTSLRIGVVSNQLEKDFMGAFIPLQARLKEEKEEPEDSKEGEAKSQKKEDGKKEDTKAKESKKEQALPEKTEKTKKPAEKPLEKIFYATQKNGFLDTLTFITNNPLTVFVGKNVGLVKPKIVRVSYTLKPEDEKNKKSDTFVLIRQESNELDLAKSLSARSYEVINGIKECSVSYIARIKKEEEKKKNTGAAPAAKAQQQEPEQKIEYEYKTVKEWVSEPKEAASGTAEQQEESKFPRIPYMIEIKMSLWNMQRTKTEDFVLLFELPIDISEPAKEEEKQPTTKKETEKSDGKDKPDEKNKQEQKMARHTGQDSKDNLMSTLSTTLGNITKMFNGKIS